MFYFDLKIINNVFNSEEDSIPIHDISAKIFKILHGVNSRNLSKFALDFLSSDAEFVFRILSPEESVLNSTMDELKKHFFINDYAVLSTRIRLCKETNRFIENRRKRIPNQKSKVRQKCLDYCKTLLHFRYKSKSNNNNAVIFVDQIESSKTDSFDPSNYGLSRPTAPFSIPRF